MEAHAMTSLETLGTWFRHTGILSLPTVLAKSVTHAVQDVLSHHIAIRMVLLGQDADFHMSGYEINAFLQSISDQGDCEWTCDHYWAPSQREGISRSAISVVLKHRTRRENFPLKSVILRELCSSLVGLHQFSGRRFRVVPEWQLSGISDTHRIFGSYLILMQLGDFYDRSAISVLSSDEKRDWAEQILWLLEQFFQQFGELLTYLSDEDTEAIYDMIKLTPDMRQLVALLRRLVEAVHSRQNLREVEKEFRRVPTQYLVKLMACSMEPLYKCGEELHRATESLGTSDDCSTITDVSSTPETVQLMGALRRVIGSNTIFSGAIGVLSRDINNERETKRGWTVAAGAVAAMAYSVSWPLAIYSAIISASSGFEWYRKTCEQDQVQQMGKFSNEVGIAGTACRLYVLLVATKAGSFFEDGTPHYESYQRLLKKIMDVNIEHPDIQVNDFVKEKSAEICDKIDATWEIVLKHAEDYSVRVPHSEKKESRIETEDHQVVRDECQIEKEEEHEVETEEEHKIEKEEELEAEKEDGEVQLTAPSL